MRGLKDIWRRTPPLIRKPFIFAVGGLIVIVGIILIPLPGPGWAIVFVGLAILATEFELAMRLKITTQNRLIRAALAAKKRAKRLRKK
ncbi:MAG TPA: TIGR02611 family protein [Candidatus Saccharimonadales bacterium]|nr:TIGR02611 family protein [Candidatus Saccharimonadales bacterium]